MSAYTYLYLNLYFRVPLVFSTSRMYLLRFFKLYFISVRGLVTSFRSSYKTSTFKVFITKRLLIKIRF